MFISKKQVQVLLEVTLTSEMCVITNYSSSTLNILSIETSRSLDPNGMAALGLKYAKAFTGIFWQNLTSS